MVKRKLLVSLILIFAIFSALTAQKYASDQITRKNGKIINCKITSIDSTQIDFVYHQSDNSRKTFISLTDIESYIYQGTEFNPNDPGGKQYFDYVELQSWKNPTQELFEAYEQPSTIIRLSLLFPSLLIENKVSPKTTLVVQFQTGFIYSEMTDNRGNTTSSFDFIPTIRFGPRFYTSLASRRGYWNSGIGASLTGVNGDFNLQLTGEFGLGFILTK